MIKSIEHCEPFQYMHAQTILNGLLNKERDGNAWTYPDFRPFKYFSNYGGSIWDENYAIWQFLKNDYSVDNCPNLSWSPESYQTYEGVLAPAKSSGNYEPAMNWLHEHLLCAVQLRQARQPGESGYDYAKAFVSFYDVTMPIIETAITNFVTSPNVDPTHGAYGILAANSNGVVTGFATSIGGIPSGTPYNPQGGDQAAQIAIAYPSHILGLKTSYGPNYPTTSKPVIWAQRNLQEDDSYPWGPFFWLSISYQQALNQYHSPR